MSGYTVKSSQYPFRIAYVSSEVPELSLERFSRSTTPHQNMSQHRGVFLKTRLTPEHSVIFKVIDRKLPSPVLLVQIQVIALQRNYVQGKEQS